MRFTLEIDGDGSAFAASDQGRAETVRLLRETAQKVDSGSLWGYLYDENGNRVGEFTGEVEEPDEVEDDGQPDEAQEWHDYDPDC